MNIKDLKEKILDEIRYGELNNDMGYVPEWLGKTDMPRHAEDEKCFRDGVTCKRYTDAVIVKTAFDEFEKTDGPDINVGTKWIPCSERLPVPNEYDETGKFFKAYLVQTKSNTMHTALWDGTYWTIWTRGIVIDKVIAWMPLPEPYKESEE